MTRISSLPRSVLPFIAVAALAVAACGHSTQDEPRSADTAPRTPSPFASPRAGLAAQEYESASPAPPPAVASRSESAGAAADRAYQPAPEKQRPGLGTEWGETRESRVSSAPFERQNWTTPLSTSSLQYNDEAGVRAMLGARYWDRRSDGISAAHGSITIKLVDESGTPLPTFSSGGRSYVMGQDGGRYSIRIENRTGARFEAVASVDGLDVIDGQPGSFEKRGYLVAPWATVEIDGFRRSDEVVAAFRFGRVRDSYAAKKGDDRNVGVIGVAVFEERGTRWPWTERELERRNSADPFPGRFAQPPSY
jgi:hypothetical protein